MTKQVKPQDLKTLTRYLLLLLPFLLLLFLPSRVIERSATLASLRDEVSRVETQVAALRKQAAELPTLQSRLAQLEAEFRAVNWPPDPRTRGVGWLEEALRSRGWNLKRLEVADAEPFPGGVEAVGIQLRAEVPSYRELVGGLEGLLASRLAILSLRVEKSDRGLVVDLRLKAPVVRVESPSAR